MSRLLESFSSFGAGSLEAIGSSLHVASLPRKVFLLGLSMGGNHAEEARMRERLPDPRRDFTCR